MRVKHSKLTDKDLIMEGTYLKLMLLVTLVVRCGA